MHYTTVFFICQHFISNSSFFLAPTLCRNILVSCKTTSPVKLPYGDIQRKRESDPDQVGNLQQGGGFVGLPK